SVANRVYDGTVNMRQQLTLGTLDGVEAVDASLVSIDATSITAELNSKDVGTGKLVTVLGYDLTGAEASNYTVTDPTGLTADIAKRVLTLTNISVVDTLVGVVAADESVGSVTLDANGATGVMVDKKA
ncbi:hypothetical protein HY29_18535, partial [Hyphomonas beringensis]